jgi:hypothetical protein
MGNTDPKFLADVAAAAVSGFNVVRPSQHGEEPKVLQSFDTAEEAQEWIDALDPQDAAYLPFVEAA